MAAGMGAKWRRNPFGVNKSCHDFVIVSLGIISLFPITCLIFKFITYKRRRNVQYLRRHWCNQ